jgi:YD repeat-containing protein
MSFAYADARSDLTGRGFIGVGSRTMKDEQTGTVVTTVYDNTGETGFAALGYPKAGLPKAEMVATPLFTTEALTFWRTTTTTNEYDVTAEGSGLEIPVQPPYNVRAKRSAFKVQELAVDSGAPFPSQHIGAPGVVDPTTVPGAHAPDILSDFTTTFDGYDAFNNLTESTTRWSSGEIRSYRGTYANEDGTTDPTLFILGMQTRSETSSSPRPSEFTKRVVTYEPDTRTGLVKKMHVQPDAPSSAEQNVDIEYTRNAFGQVMLVTSTAKDPVDATAMTRTQSFGYDDGDGVFPSSVTNAMGHTSQMLHHPGFGVLGFAMDPNGVKTALQYDGFARLRTRTTDGRGPFTTSYLKIDLGPAGTTRSMAIHTEQAGGGAQTTFYNELGHPYVTHERASLEGANRAIETATPTSSTAKSRA